MAAGEWQDVHATEAADGFARMSASVAAALALHAGVVAMLAGRGATRFELVPAPIVVTFALPAARTEGPGARSEELHVAKASAETRVESTPPPANPAMTLPRELEPSDLPHPETVPGRRPKPVARIAPPAKTPAAEPAAARSSPPQLDTAATARGEAVATSSAGTSEAASAPSWAPAARVRYEELLFAWIDRHKEYPLLAQRRGLEGSGSIRVRIGRDGRLIERSLVRSTGQPMLDDAALEMVRRSTPFPAVPSEYSGASFEFVAPVEYHLR